MASTAASPSVQPPPALPRPAAPPPGLVVARWLYVDAAHTHEVRAGVRPGPKPEFVIRESTFHNDRPDEFVEQALAIESPWETQLFHWQLECRLSMLGKYWRLEASENAWRPLVAPQGRPDLDTREVMANPYGGRVILYHFHDAADAREKLLVAIPNASPIGKRYLLALATLDLLNSPDAHIHLIHAHLPEAPTRSVVVREHMALRGTRWQKLVSGSDFERTLGPHWARATAAAYAEILRRISEGSFGSPERPRSDAHDAIYTDFVRALTDPRLLALQAHFLTPDEQEKALATGEHAIRRLITTKRATATADEQHKLTMVEASLLARDQLRPGERVDPEVSALVRRFSYYL